MPNLRFTLRQLFKSPGFTFVAIATLALGIGANTAIYSVVDKLLIRSLPVKNPERLALIGSEFQSGQFYSEFNYPLFLDYQRDNTVFERLTATAEITVGFGTGGATERSRAALVSGNYFDMLGIDAAIGRVFARNEGVELDDAPVVVLSHGLWQRRFGADPQVIGRTAALNGKPFTIIGVAPREFTGTYRGQLPELYVPFTMFGQLDDERPGGSHPLATRYFTWHQIMGRLKDGVTFPQAQESMRSLARQIHAVTPANTDTNLVVIPGAQGFNEQLREARLPLNLLLATTVLVLLITCANLANLQLARASARARDYAIRAALGAGRSKLIGELLMESIFLSLLGGGLGFLLANWLTGAIQKFSSYEMPGGMDHRLFLFTLSTSVVTGILFGLAPSWQASKPNLVPVLKGVPAEGQIRRWQLQSGLVVVQVALSLLVLAGAGLCVRSLKKLQHLEVAYEPSKVVLMSFDLGLNSYNEPRADEFYDRLLTRTRTLPGVEAASLALTTPLSGQSPGMSIERIEDYQPAPNEHPSGDFNYISPDYFRTLGIQVLSGREFNASDNASGPKVVVVDETFSQKYCSGGNPVGKRIFLFGPDGPGGGGVPTEIVGVVSSTRSRNLTSSPRRTMFFPVSQRSSRSLTLAFRTGLSSAGTIQAIKETVKDLDANVPVFRVQTLEDQRNGALVLQRMAALLLSAFGLLALSLAALGLYGVLAYSVSRRTREIGVRMALGAQITDVLSLVMKQGLRLVIFGGILGLICACAATRVLRGFLYEVKPLDPLTFLTVSALLLAVAFVACWLPARRAAKVDPMVALRQE